MTVLEDLQEALERAVLINRKDPEQWQMAAVLAEMANILDCIELEQRPSTIDRTRAVELERILFQVRSKLEAAVEAADYSDEEELDKSVDTKLITPVIELLAEVTDGR